MLYNIYCIMQEKKIDRFFMLAVATLLVAGFFIFYSASLGLLTREGIKFSSVLFNQIFLGFFLGVICLFITSKIHYSNYRKFAFYLFLFSLVLTALVFIPALGFEHGGAKRWLSIGSFSFQPSEFLKLGFVLYFAAWLASVKSKVKTFKFGVLPMLIMLFLSGAILLKQPDTGTFLVIFITAMSMLFVAGAKWKHIFLVILLATVAFVAMAYYRPYIKERVMTFLHPTLDTQGSGYQIKQSLIAVGSGQIFGRGFGKSIQKFNFLPEPIGDSIFAVMSEEWGFVGGVFLITLFLIFTFRGFVISSMAPDDFSRLLVIGIVILIISQSFINIASMLGIFPLTGMPLLFVSQGGTALMMTLLEVGIIFNISKYKKI